jgi:hypothetical protein
MGRKFARRKISINHKQSMRAMRKDGYRWNPAFRIPRGKGGFVRMLLKNSA